jgi:hypothetical protein
MLTRFRGGEMRLIRMLIFAIASQDVDHRFRKRDRKDDAGVGHDSQHFEDRAADATKVDARGHLQPQNRSRKDIRSSVSMSALNSY